ISGTSDRDLRTPRGPFLHQPHRGKRWQPRRQTADQGRPILALVYLSDKRKDRDSSEAALQQFSLLPAGLLLQLLQSWLPRQPDVLIGRGLQPYHRGLREEGRSRKQDRLTVACRLFAATAEYPCCECFR